ncbi:MAG TPA: DUF192 domain-containing protein [Acidimicrobiia bacterium]|nr:DUF192 domain-containing protein [Acidimicrobiia bacterium]
MLALAACSGTTSPGQSEAVSSGTTVAPVADTTVVDTTVTTVVDGVQFDTAEVAVGDIEFRVWVADTPTERSQGLRRVEELPTEIDGMLFVWETPTPAVFGMRDTLIPLDVWFFDEEGRLVGTHEMSPCLDSSCAGYPSPGPVRWALETPLGVVELDEGDRLSTSPSG